MTDNVHNLSIVQGDGCEPSVADVMRSVPIEDLGTVCVIGQYPNGELYVASTCGAGNTLVSLERAKLELIGL